MIDKARIEAEAEHFFEWPTKDRSYVTTTSAVIFASTIAEMARAEVKHHSPDAGKLVKQLRPLTDAEISECYKAGVKAYRKYRNDTNDAGEYGLNWHFAQAVMGKMIEVNHEAQ